jgi:ribonuclease VapC
VIALDTSAIVALLRHEPDAEKLAARMSAASQMVIGRPTELELHMVTTGKIGEAAARAAIGRILSGVQRIDFDEAHLVAATTAFDRFGKGRHPASLNYGDCMAYAVARVAGCPLLYKGEDFARTDIRSAL